MRPILPRVVAALAAGVFAGAISGCASLPSLEGREPSVHIADTAATPLGRAVANAALPEGASGVHQLPAPLDAFAARVALIRAAERSLDIQYYIWHPDVTGTLLIREVRSAASRGVRVRMLLDDNGIAGLDPDLAVLDAHPNVEVRLFNPYLNRGFKALGYLTDFERLNHRMHNKSLTADSQATVVGGRNVGDSYYGADPHVVFSDLDVLAVGPVARDVARAFDEYWNSDAAYPAAAIIGAPAPGAERALDERIAAVEQSEDARSYGAAVQAAPLVEQMLAGRVELERASVRLFYDPPAKAHGDLDSRRLLAAQLARVLGEPRVALDLVSPYFVPGKLGTEHLVRLAGQGVKLRVVTNSLAATDVTAVHAGYAKRRKDLLRAGVRIYELKPDPDALRAGAEDSRGWWQKLTGSSAASLHGKTFAIDRSRIFVGSFNFDPRSVRLNTEMGVIVESGKLAGALAQGLDHRLSHVAYELRLADDGEIEWIERTPAGEVRYRTEPKASLGRRIGVSILSVLPIEGML